MGKASKRRNGAILEGPVCNGTEVIGWHLDRSKRWARARRFHMDMSGFAFNSTILWDPKRWHRPALEPIRQLDTVKERFQVILPPAHALSIYVFDSVCSVWILLEFIEVDILELKMLDSPLAPCMKIEDEYQGYMTKPDMAKLVLGNRKECQGRIDLKNFY